MAAFTTYEAVETPQITLEDFPLIDKPIDLPWASYKKDDVILVKPKSKLIANNPEEIQTDDSNLSFEQMIKKHNLPVRITSGFRGYGTKTAQGKPSNHGKLDEHGSSMAYDIVPLNGDFDNLLQQIYSNKNIVNWFKSKGWGILEETTPDIMKQTRATGKHLHIGPDPGAIKMFNNRLAKGAKGMKVPFTEYEPVSVQPVELNFPLMDKPIDISSWSDYVTEDNVPIVKRRLIQDNPQEIQVQTQVIKDNSTSNNDAVQFFINKGLDKNHAVGIVANLMQESGLNAKAVNPNSGAYGIAQWLGDRKKKLFNKYGNNPTYEQQLEYVWEELNSTEKIALNKLLSTKSYAEATNSIMNHYERPSAREKADSISRRLSFAKSLYNGNQV